MRPSGDQNDGNRRVLGTVGRMRRDFLGKVVASVLWDSGGILLVGFLKRGATVA